MRPLKLEMSAFGPYLDKSVVDFTEFGDNELFLVTGKTGSGKTFIFDAISYALYGEPSGDDRKDAPIRSVQAGTSAVETYVEFSFEHEGKTYRIKRTPSYIRESKRATANGNGLATNPASAEIYCDDKLEKSGEKNVTAYIEELIGLSRKQFSQICMIAQGGFKKFLDSKTDDKAEMLRKIFSTEKYQEVESSLKDLLDAQKRQYAEQQTRRSEQLSNVVLSSNSVYADELQRLRSADVDNNVLVNTLNAIVAEDSNEYAGIEAAIKTLEDEKAPLEDLQRQYKAQEDNIKRLPVKRKELEASLIRKKELENQEDAIPALEREKADCEKLEKWHAYYQTKSARKEKLSSLKNDFEAVSNSRKDVLNKLAAIEDEIAKTVTDEVRRAEANARLEKLKFLAKSLDGYSNDKDALDDLQQKKSDAENLYASTLEKHAEVTEGFIHGQADVIANELHDGDVCPICGGTFHHSGRPNCVAKQYGKDDFDRSSRALESAKSALDGAIAKVDQMKGLVQSEEKELSSQSKAIVGMDDLDSVPALVNNESDKLDEEIKALDASAARRAELEAERESAIESQQVLQECEQGKKTLIDTITGEISMLDANMTQIADELKLTSESDCLAKAEGVVGRSALIEKQINGIRTEARDCFQVVSDLQAWLAANEKPAEEASKIDIAFVKSRIAAIDNQLADLNPQRNKTLLRTSTNKGCAEKIEDIVSQMTVTEKRKQTLDCLYRTFSGQLGGKQKVSLETYVQMPLFELMLQGANARLGAMTNNRYDLVRRVQAANLATDKGLDLDVMDHLCGSARSVSSLSGGESFMASLALALGVSDMVQSISGGIKLDAMFIDEGFGTLDDDGSLDNAMKALKDLTGGKTLVGIISHVDRLKECIEKQIVVAQNNDGTSSITMTA